MHQIEFVYLKRCAFLLSVVCGVPSALTTAADSSILDTNKTSSQHVAMLPQDIRENLIENDQQVPDEALNGVYSECILGLSFTCLQRKLVVFLLELDQMKNIRLIGDSVVVVRRDQVPADTIESAKIVQYVDQTYLKQIIDHLIEKFFDNHFLRVKIPRYLYDSRAAAGEDDKIYLDIDFKTEREVSVREGRKKMKDKKKRYDKKMKKKFKLKGMKKLMMMIGLMTCVKLAMMAPVMLGMIGLKAMKALIFSVMALTIHKMMWLQKHNLGSLISSSHEGWSSGGHSSGWDRNINEVAPTSSTSALPYYIEPPAPYSSHTASA